jgi:hypothetical protein
MRQMRAIVIAIVAVGGWGGGAVARAEGPGPSVSSGAIQAGAVLSDADVQRLEEAVIAEPENLFLAADYRQAIIARGEFDRSIGVFRKLTQGKAAGPNAYISLALAYVDKVPPSGELRRLYLARDAISALTKAIDREVTVLALYIRGLINLYFNRFIFRRVSHGIADLERARGMIDDRTPGVLAARVFLSLGDGYWQDDKPQKAREVWKAGLSRFTDHEGLRTRLVPDERVTTRAVKSALYAGRRVDTSLRELNPH